MEVPVFRPTLKEFTSGFSNYISAIQPLCAEYGLAKIIPPPEWNPLSANWYQEKTKNLKIRSPISQHLRGKNGIYQSSNVVQRTLSFPEFQKLAEGLQILRDCDSDGQQTFQQIEDKFWKTILTQPPMYGADLKGTLFPPELQDWNMSNLANQTVLRYIGMQVDGINVPYLYFGMWKSMFSWHTEDMDLYSINYVHFGQPKKWYGIPESDRRKFEAYAQSQYPSLHQQCDQFLRHKTTMFAPDLLREAGIRVVSGIQQEGEFMMTFPGVYHAGFNFGLNCAEAVNFATDSWIPRGLKAKACKCKPYSVHIDMQLFLQNYERFSDPNEELIKLETPSFDLENFALMGPEQKKVPCKFGSSPEPEQKLSSSAPEVPGVSKTIKKKPHAHKQTRQSPVLKPDPSLPTLVNSSNC